MQKSLCFSLALSLAVLTACGDDVSTDGSDNSENPRDLEDAGPNRPRDKPDASKPRAGSGGGV